MEQNGTLIMLAITILLVFILLGIIIGQFNKRETIEETRIAEGKKENESTNVIVNTIGNIEFSYEKERTTKEGCIILIKVKEEKNGIEKIVYPDDEDVLICKGRNEVAIEAEDGTKTIETTSTKKDTGRQELDKSEQEKYKITNVQVNKKGLNTVVTGEVKNNDSKEHDIIVNIKFYSDDNKIKSETSTNVIVGANKSEKFEMTMMDDMTEYTYKIFVEYSD